jgi:hypothetical protein
MIELDPKRIAKVTPNAEDLTQRGFVLPSQSSSISDTSTNGLATSTTSSSTSTSKPSFFQSIASRISSFTQNLAGQVLGKALSQFYSSIEKLGFTAGGEFQAAVEEAKNVQSKVLLGDRDVDITLQRLAQAFSSVSPDR